MKISSLLLIAVVVLNSVDESLQGNCFGKCRSSKGSPAPSPPPSPPPRPREPSPPKPRFPFLPQGSRIIRGFEFPRELYYKTGPNSFWELVLHYDAVLNYERKVVAIFLQTYENQLFGLYHGKGGSRIKLTPACFEKGHIRGNIREHIREHIDELDDADYHYYPEFHYFEKPAGIILKSLEAYQRLGRGLSCTHTSEMRDWFFDLPPEAHIVRDVEFPEGFFFKIDQDGLFHPLLHHNCDVVVDPSGMIVAVFLGPHEYRLLGIYRGEGGNRVKLTHISMEAEHFPFNYEESELYIEFMVYKKPEKMYRDSFAECGQKYTEHLSEHVANHIQARK